MSLSPSSLAGEDLRHFRHELRTPLNHIIGVAEILIDDATDAGRTAPVAALQQIRAAGYAILESMREALPSELNSMDSDQLALAAARLRPEIAELLGSCIALEATGAYAADPDGLENLQTVENAVRGMGKVLDGAVPQE